MASSNVIIVPKEIGRRADGLINSGVSASVIKGVELLLQENIYIEGGSALPAISQLDCSALFRKGTNALQNVPFDLLGVEVNCQTVDVRKAYKKLALKYHPDKNPKTTPLFQLIQAASTKLTDSDQRAKEAATVAQKRGAAGLRAEHRASAASFQSAFQKHQSANPTSFPSAKPTPAQGAYPSQTSQAQAGYRQQPQQQPQQQQQQYAYQQYQFKQQGQAQPQQQQQQQQSYQSQQQQSKPQQATPQATPNVYGQPQPSYNAQYQQYMNQQQRPQQPAAAQPSSSSSSAQPNKAAADMKGRNYYEELLKEQYRKAAAAEERAREYANRRFAEQQQKFGAAAYNNGSAANNPFDQRSGQQQSQPNLNPFRQPGNQPANAVPTANGNPVGVPPAYEWSNVNKPAAAQPGKAAASAASAAPSATAQSNPTGGGAAGTARTYRAGADGKVHVQQSFPTSNAAGGAAANGIASQQQQQRKMHVPKPYDFKFSSVSSTVVELEWKTTQMHHCNLAVEFSWKEKFPSFTPWETAEKLIRAGCCRKKNLKPKACYEFRVRAVEEMAGGQLGNRSDWTEVLTIVMPTVEQANPSSSAFPKMPAAGTNVEATPTPDVSDSYAKKSTAAAKAAAAAAASTATPTPAAAASQASSSANAKPAASASAANQPSATAATTTAANAAAKKPTTTNVNDAKSKPPAAAASSAASAAASNAGPTRPRTPTQEKPSDEKVFKRFKSKSTLSKDDSGIFSPAQFQFETDTNMKPRSLDDSGPLQRKGTMQSKASAAGAASDAAHSSPIEKTLNKYFSKDKVLTASQREAWGKEQAQHQQQQQQPRSRGAAVTRKSSGGGDGSRMKPSPPTQARPSVPQRPDAYSDDEFDEEEVSEENEEQGDEEEEEEEEEEEVIKVDLDKAAMRGGVASVSSFDEDLLGSGSSFNHHSKKKKKQTSGQQSTTKKKSKQSKPKKSTISQSPDDGANSITDEVGDEDDNDNDDDEVPDEILEESEYTDSDYSSVASHPHGTGRKKLRPKRTKQSSMASRHRGSSGSGNGYSGNGPTPVKKLDAHGNPFDFFELDASFDTMDTDEIQYYQLHPPSIGNGMSNNALNKKSLSPIGKDGTPVNTGQVQVNYRHPVHAEPYPKSAIKGYIKPDRTIVGCALVGEWVRVKIHMAIYDTSNNNDPSSQGKKQPSKAIWGWCLRSDGSHDFLRPIQGTRSSLSSVQSNTSVSGGGGGFSTPMTKSNATATNSANAPTSSAKKMMSPPKESLQRGMTKANLGASAILNQSFFNLPKQTPTKEKLKKKASMAVGGGNKPQYPAFDETEEVEYGGTKGKKSTAAGAGAGGTAGGRKPPPSNSIDENDDHNNNVEVWVECFDQQGHVYYYNEKTMVSKWELPEWVEEEDPTSGAKYYVHAVGYGDNITMMSTWTKPKKFARLIRAQHYT